MSDIAQAPIAQPKTAGIDYDNYTPIYHKIETALFKTLAPCQLVRLWNDFCEATKQKAKKIYYAHCGDDLEEAFDSSFSLLADTISIYNSFRCNLFDNQLFTFDGSMLQCSDIPSGLSAFDDHLLIMWLIEDGKALRGYRQLLEISDSDWQMTVKDDMGLYSLWADGYFAYEPKFKDEPKITDFGNPMQYAQAWALWMSDLANHLVSTHKLQRTGDGYVFYS